MSDLPDGERLTKLRVLEEWLAWQLEHTRRKIRDLEQAQNTPVAYVIEPKQHPKHPEPARIHLATCTMPERKTIPVDASQARIGLTKDPENTATCDFCDPGESLGVNGYRRL